MAFKGKSTKKFAGKLAMSAAEKKPLITAAIVFAVGFLVYRKLRGKKQGGNRSKAERAILEGKARRYKTKRISAIIENETNVIIWQSQVKPGKRYVESSFRAFYDNLVSRGENESDVFAMLSLVGCPNAVFLLAVTCT